MFDNKDFIVGFIRIYNILFQRSLIECSIDIIKKLIMNLITKAKDHYPVNPVRNNFVLYRGFLKT